MLIICGVLMGWLEETKHVYITHILEMILTVFFFEKRRRFLEKLSVRLGLETKQGWATLRFLGVGKAGICDSDAML